MNRMMLLASAAVLAGCHGKYKKAAPALGSVHPIVGVDGTAEVWMDAEEAAGPTSNPAIGISQLVVGAVLYKRGARVENVLTDRVAPADIQAEAIAGVSEGAESPPLPFMVDDEGVHPLLITVERYGVVVEDGLPSVASELSFELYDADSGERLYRADHRCVTPFHRVDIPDVPMLGVHELVAMKQLDKMSGKKLSEAVSWQVRACAEEAARQMAVHAGAVPRERLAWSDFFDESVVPGQTHWTPM